MRPLFSAGGQARLHWILRHRPLLAFDWDGTLVPLAERTSEATMEPGTRALFRRVARRWPTAIVSGRARRALRVLAGGLGAVALVGNHGMEGVGQDRRRERWTRIVRGWRPVLAEMAALRGVHVEDKVLSVSVHFGDAPDRHRTRTILRRLAAQLDGARGIPGKAVLNLVPADAPDKGTAVQALARTLGRRAILFVGDDVTDEAAFRLRGPPPLMGVRVGQRAGSAAQWFVRNPRGVVSLLERLGQVPGRGG
jgi:trehalose 6-phosphate phosphatase